MFPPRQWIPRLAAVGLLAGLVLFPDRRVISLASQNPGDARDGAAPRTGESLAASPVERAPRGPASPGPAEDRWAGGWRELCALPEGPECDQEKAALLEALAALDPRRALSLAGAETNPELRAEFFQAALRGWGGANPWAAIAWARAQTFLDQGQAMSAVFHGAACDPEKVLGLAVQLSAQDPGRAGDYGSYLVAALNRAGEFNRAAGFAADAPAEFRVDLLNAAYAGWGDREPQAALMAIGELSDPEAKKMAFDATISHWANHDARAAAEYALDLPAGREKTFALSVALRAWAASDAVAAGTWMNRLEASPELDLGAAVIASLPQSLQQPQVAAGWAQSITDFGLRTRVLATVVEDWAATDPVAALFYAENSPDIRPEDRAAVLLAFQADFNPVSLSP